MKIKTIYFRNIRIIIIPSLQTSGIDCGLGVTEIYYGAAEKCYLLLKEIFTTLGITLIGEVELPDRYVTVDNILFVVRE